MKLLDVLDRAGALDRAWYWIDEHTMYHTWENCNMPHCMLWVAGMSGVDERLLVTCACHVIREVVYLCDDHQKEALASAEAWGKGELESAPNAFMGAGGPADVAAWAYYTAAWAAESAPRDTLCDVVRKHISVDTIRAALGGAI